MHDDANFPSQHIWSDAVFIHHVQKIKALDQEKLLKLGVLATIYGSIDLAFFCLIQCDTKYATSFARTWNTILHGT